MTPTCRIISQVRLLLMVLLLAPSLSSAFDELPKEPPISDSDRQHWSFRPLVRPAVPIVTSKSPRLANWCRQPLDAFILKQLQQANLEPAPEADRITLIRRLSFQLTGLPPSPEDVDVFVNDPLPDAYERLVDRLLASPAFGERWAQHWLDLARFAETDGYEHDKIRPEAWRFRDWVIDALNADLPYDDFLKHQLAGDELHPDLRVATGFLVSGPDMPDVNVQEERRTAFLNDLTSTVSSTLFGLQLGCAQCHDHKYDPLSQHDFYRLRAFFDRAFEFKRDQLMAPLNGNKFDVPTAFLIRGDFRRPSSVLEPGFPRIANLNADRPQVLSNRSNLRRELARWATQPNHPLTTRVMVNRLWQHLFGEGLSSTTSDFGVMGESPVQEELLNWLATELPRRQWSVKDMLRLLVSSATYRQASRLPSDVDADSVTHWQQSLKRDPLGRLHSRQRRQRLDGEAIRDALLVITEQLNTRRGGQGVRPPLPPELVGTLLKNQWVVTEDKADWNRRSIYLFMRRNLRFPLFEAFDRPDALASCPRRNRSTIAPQALLLLNSELSFQHAQYFAAQLRASGASTSSAMIDQVYQRALSRLPSHQERAAALQFLETNDAAEFESRIADLCLAVFNLNEFVYID